jgi:hypothetical protein
LTGPNPTDRGKNGAKIHVICDRNGLPISVGVSAANLHDSQALVPMMRGIPPIRSYRGPRRRRPARLHADKGYDFEYLRNWLRRKQIVPRIARWFEVGMTERFKLALPSDLSASPPGPDTGGMGFAVFMTLPPRLRFRAYTGPLNRPSEARPMASRASASPVRRRSGGGRLRCDRSSGGSSHTFHRRSPGGLGPAR